MKKLYVIVLILLSTQNVFAQKKVEKSYAECTKQEDRLPEKLTAYEKFSKVDNDKENLVFWKANLIFSTIMPQYSDKNTKKKGVFFSIQPMWILPDALNPIAVELYPSFVAQCENKTNPLSLSCKFFQVPDKRLRFAVNDFSLSLSITTDAKCSSGSKINISYYIIINDPEYAKLKKALIASNVPENETDPEKFLNSYWTEFFNAWKNKNDWLEE